MPTPLVSICCVAYNHEQFIRGAIEGFLRQQVDFPIEILVHDDASTDRTPEILREYESQHPELIRVTYQTQNQYSRGVRPLVHVLYPQARGRYIALCEGDDAWTDPLKLRDQVEHMETDTRCVLTCGGYESVAPDGSRQRVVLAPASGDSESGFPFGLEEMKTQWLAMTLTVVFRRDALRPGWSDGYRHLRDVHLFYHIMKQGRGFYFRRVLGDYNIHSGGIHSTKPQSVRTIAFYECARELHQRNGDDFTRDQYLQASVMLLSQKLFEDADTSPREVSALAWRALRLARTPRELSWVLAAFIKPSVRKSLLQRIRLR